MKKTNYFKKVIFTLIALPINLLAIALGILGIILIRSKLIANKLHIKLESSEKAKYIKRNK